MHPLEDFRDTQRQKGSKTLVIELFFINNYAANSAPIYKTSKNTINYKWTGNLLIRSLEKSSLISDNVNKFLHECLHFY